MASKTLLMFNSKGDHQKFESLIKIFKLRLQLKQAFIKCTYC